MTKGLSKEDIYREALETICAFELPKRWYRISDEGCTPEKENVWLTRLREVHTIAFLALNNATEGDDSLDEEVL